MHIILNKGEETEFIHFLSFIEKNKRSSFVFRFADDSKVNATYFTICESENCLELDDPNYEEYWAIFFNNVETGESFEVNYHNMPVEVWCDGKKVGLEDFKKCD